MSHALRPSNTIRVNSHLWNVMESEAVRSHGGASRARSGEQNVSKGSPVHILSGDPACKAALAEHVLLIPRS